MICCPSSSLSALFEGIIPTSCFLSSLIVSDRVSDLLPKKSFFDLPIIQLSPKSIGVIEPSVSWPTIM